MIDRRALVDRHAVVIDGVAKDSPLSVGNGEFCFTADLTGLQSLPGRYPLGPRNGGAPGSLLTTEAQWAWHSCPLPGGAIPEPSRRSYATRKGQVPYLDYRGPLEPAPGEAPNDDQWLRANPHRLDLGRIGLCRLPDGAALDPTAMHGAHQRLDLWAGRLESRFSLGGHGVFVRTLCHPSRNLLAVRLTAPARANIAVAFAFPYGSMSWNLAADWTRDDAHRSELSRTAGGWRIERALDDTRYRVAVRASAGASLERSAAHGFVLSSDQDAWWFVAEFAPEEAPEAPLPSFASVEEAAALHWAAFWTDGAAIELAASKDPRAHELERRAVLSQYLTAINCAGSLPPQETGLTVNSWYGRFHLEMHFWHGAHFPLWGRPELLEPSMAWYGTHLEKARELARAQGYRGARWPKQVGPDGREGPSPISAFLIWQQPHPIYLAELLYRSRPSPITLERYGQVVLATAEFMADFAEETPAGFELGPPLVPAQECDAAERARLCNPTFELSYFAFGLELAQTWRERLGLGCAPWLTTVAERLVPPVRQDGIYAANGVPPFLTRSDHPAMCLALGFLPPSRRIDPAVMSATLDSVLADWDWASTWGWDFPALAMCAARLARDEDAVALLTMDVAKNRYLPNGHNYQGADLPCYLPGNGALLSALALMAGGWPGATRPAPGFPADGAWRITAEDFPGVL
ncbi:MAG: hypothetical protein M0004_06075 [Actinomycetota bacterium]|nr:hypothetical protein [Actinomycetota bacterium]